jgi:hypothetical protein
MNVKLEDGMIQNMTEIQQDWLLIMETKILECVTAKGHTRLHTFSGRHAEMEALGPPVGLFCTELCKIPVTQKATEEGNRRFNHKPTNRHLSGHAKSKVDSLTTDR